ncbi:MAG TPA: hypothetical protein H9744_07915 [Candidatus Eisenbergiella stercoravium]|nr:hypothetical protein [Candidatus Eisenbergiella stercoravium]
MDKKSNSFFSIVKGFVVLGILIGVVVAAIQYIVNIISNAIVQITQVTSNVDAVIIVALITGAVSILGVLLSSIVAKILEYRQNTKRYLYEKRETPYSDFIEMVYKLQQGVKNKNGYSNEQMMEDIVKFSQKLTLWGSSRVIRKWLKFRETSQALNNNPTDNLFVLEDIIFEIRRDMGQKKGGLKKGDLLAFFVNDIRDYLPKNSRKER